VGYIKPIACVLFFASLFALLAVAATTDERRRPWAGAIGGPVGFWFGLIAGGVTTGGRLLDALYPPGEKSGGGDP
jgi:hypothetical protein